MHKATSRDVLQYNIFELLFEYFQKIFTVMNEDDIHRWNTWKLLVVFYSRSNQNQIEVQPNAQPWDWLIREWRRGKPIIRSQLILITEEIIQIMGRAFKQEN